MSDATDWEIDSNGLYVATRSVPFAVWLLLRQPVPLMPRINWHNTSTWHHLTVEAVKVAAVPPKALEGTRKALALHEQRSQQEGPGKAAYHRAMIAHYRLLEDALGSTRQIAKTSVCSKAARVQTVASEILAC